MNRREFISASCISCIGGSLFPAFLESCGTASRIVSADISGSDMIVSLAEFETLKDGKKSFKKYIVLQNERLKYPVCVYRFNESEYEALWMRCTHQGTELQVFGDQMQCPAHGSEFNNRGKVVNGPASTPLKSFPVTITDNQLKISLL